VPSSSPYIGYYNMAKRHVETADAAIVHQEMSITRLRMRGMDTTMAEEMLARMRQRRRVMLDDEARFDEHSRAFGLIQSRTQDEGYSHGLAGSMTALIPERIRAELERAQMLAEDCRRDLQALQDGVYLTLEYIERARDYNDEQMLALFIQSTQQRSR
jgi:hypothetical protein